MVYFLVHAKPPFPLTDTKGPRWARPLRELDWLGAALCIGMVVALFLPAAVGRRDQALEKPHHHRPLLRVGCFDCDVRWMGMEEGRESAVAVDDVWAPNTGRRGARVGGCPLTSASYYGSLTKIFQLFNGMGLLAGTVRCWFYLQDICLSSVRGVVLPATLVTTIHLDV